MHRADDQHIEKILDVLEAWLSAYRGIKCFGPRLYPDRTDRTQKACDAILPSAPTPTAVEHTSIESFSGQREDDARFMRVVGSLEPELEGRLDGSLTLTIPIRSIGTKVDWDSLRSELRDKILAEHAKLPLSQQVEWNLQGLPLRLMRVRRLTGSGRLITMRALDVDITAEQATVIARAIQNKKPKLAALKDPQLRTMLVLEADDFALQSLNGIQKAFRAATSDIPVPDVDDVVLVRTSFEPWCVKVLQENGKVLGSSIPAWPSDPSYPSIDTSFDESQ